MLQETREYLDDQGLVFEGRLAYSRIMAAIKPHIPTIDVITDVERDCALVVDLRAQALGTSGDEDVDKDLNYLVGNLLSVADDGRVQKSLENGYVLCGLRTKRVVEDGGEPKSMSARFISSDPDVVETYANIPAIARAVKTASRANGTLDMTGRRIPELATRRPALAQQAQQQLALALPLPTPQAVPAAGS